MQVVEKFVLQLEAQLMDRNVSIELTPEAAEWLGRKGYDDKMGARPLGRVIQESIKKPLAEELLFGKLQKGGIVQVGVKDDDRTSFQRRPKRRGSREEAAASDGGIGPIRTLYPCRGLAPRPCDVGADFHWALFHGWTDPPRAVLQDLYLVERW